MQACSRKIEMTEEKRKARNERAKHKRINEKYAHTLLLKDHETFEELFPYGNMKQDNEGRNVLIVCNIKGTKFFKHTILTEEITQIEAHTL